MKAKRKSGGQANEKKYPVTIGKEAHSKLEIMKNRVHPKPTFKILVETMIDVFHAVNMPPREFRDYLKREKKKAETSKNVYEFLDEQKCVGFQYVKTKSDEGHYMCIWARVNKPPQSKRISEFEAGAEAYCLACNKTMEIVSGLVVRDEKIAELELELKAKVTEVFKIPKCNAGGTLNKDKEENMVFNNCRKHPSGPVSIEKFCRVYQGGLPCMMFAEVTVGAGTNQ